MLTIYRFCWDDHLRKTPPKRFAVEPVVKSMFITVAMLLLVSSLGCGPSIPPIAEVSGVVTIDGDPLPHAKVLFFPLHKGLDGNYMASGVTDKEGNYTLTHKGSVPGVTACDCKITISEGPMPPEIRKMGQAGAAKMKAYRKTLKNRPIPPSYGALGTTPLNFTVSQENPVLDLELNRN